MSREKEWLTTREAAEIASVGRDAIWRWFQLPGAPKHKRTAIGGHLRIHRRAFVEWLEQKERDRGQEQPA